MSERHEIRLLDQAAAHQAPEVGCIADHPHVPRSERFAVENFGTGFFRMTLHFGYMDAPNVPAALAQSPYDFLDFTPMHTTYFLSRETIIPSKRIGMITWRESLFAFLLKNANSTMRYFQLPTNRVIELGTQVEI